MLTKEQIQAEVQRRKLLKERMSAAIKRIFIVWAKPEWAQIKKGQSTTVIPMRAPRGAVHKFLAEEMGMTVNNKFCHMVEAVMYDLGIIPVNVKACLYYRGMTLTKEQELRLERPELFVNRTRNLQDQ